MESYRDSLLRAGRFPMVAALVAAGAVGVAVPLAVIAYPEWAVAGLGVVMVIAILIAVPRAHAAGIALGINLVLFVVVPVYSSSIHDYTILKQAVPAVCLLSSLIAVWRRWPDVNWRSGVALLFVPFLLITLASTFFSGDQLGPRQLLIFAITSLPLMALATALRGRERSILLAVFVTLGMAEAVIALAEVFVLPAPIWGYPTTANGVPLVIHSEIFVGQGRSQGTLGHPIPLAMVLAVTFALIGTGQGFRRPYWRALALAVLFGATLAAGSRSAVVIEVAVFAIWGGRNWTLRRGLIGAGLLVVGVIIAAGLGGLESGVVARLTSSFSVTQRGLSLASVPGLLTRQSPVNLLIGNGYWSEPRMFTTGLLPTDGFGAIDDQWVTTLSESGVLGSLLMIALYARGVISSAPAIRAPLLAALAMLFTFDVLLWPSGTTVLCILLGLSLVREGVPAGRAHPVVEATARPEAGATRELNLVPGR